jgi:preprotein translocase subunit SecF
MQQQRKSRVNSALPSRQEIVGGTIAKELRGKLSDALAIGPVAVAVTLGWLMYRGVMGASCVFSG